MSKEQKILLLLIILVGGAGAGFYVSNVKKSEAEAVAVTTPTPVITPVQTIPAPVTTPTPVTTPVSTATIYSQDITYPTPEEGHETIHVKLSLKDGTISDVAFSYDTPKKRESKNFLGSFEQALASQGLIGKKLSNVSLSQVGGASLTTAAFNQALSQIAAKA